MGHQELREFLSRAFFFISSMYSPADNRRELKSNSATVTSILTGTDASQHRYLSLFSSFSYSSVSSFLFPILAQ